MRRHIIHILFCYYSICAADSSEAYDPSPTPLNQGELSQMLTRLADNDVGAFEEASKLPVAQGVELLKNFIDDDATDKIRAERAREALRKLPSVPQYIKGRISMKRTKPGGESSMREEFALLGLLGGDQAAAVAASFLFVDDPAVIFPNPDSSVCSINELAAITLLRNHRLCKWLKFEAKFLGAFL